MVVHGGGLDQDVWRGGAPGCRWRVGSLIYAAEPMLEDLLVSLVTLKV